MTLHRVTERTSWGAVVRAPCFAGAVRFADEVPALVREAQAQSRSILGVGLGRSYGDTGLNPDNAIIDTRGLDRLIAFDDGSGLITAEAGISLDALLRFLAPRGWFLPTTPGTRFVTLAGAIANDVHGKNHHSAGAFGAHVRRIGLSRSDCAALEISPHNEPELFAATIGGLGLTGIITWAEFQAVRIPSTWIDQEIVPFDNLDGFFENVDAASGRFEHSAAWVDCTATGAKLGRGVMIMGAWSAEGGHVAHNPRRSANLPFNAPSHALNAVTLRAFNACYNALQRAKPRRSRVEYAAHLYPLDTIGHWNRLYGARGLYQYQCVVGRESGPTAIRAMLEMIAESGEGSFLAVLKTFGDKPSPGLLSFPKPGVTLALDFSNRGAKTLALMAKLDGILTKAGGRLYPAKDGRMSAHMFQSGFPNWRRFAEHVDPAMSSAFWRRMTA